MPIFSGEYPQKSTPDIGDEILIADSESANAIKGLKVGSLIDSFVGGMLGDVKYYTSTGGGNTWAKPDGLKYIIVEVQAAGGGGGGSGNTNGGVGAGGGGGGYSRKRILAEDLSDTETVTVGAAGTGGGAGVIAGTKGGDSSFGSHVTSIGGGGGEPGGGVWNPDNGGAATDGDFNITGQGGAPRRNGTGVGTGVGGNSVFGFGAQFRAGAANEPGGIPAGYGAGGGGGHRTSTATAGSDGTNGIVIVYEFF